MMNCSVCMITKDVSAFCVETSKYYYLKPDDILIYICEGEYTLPGRPWRSSSICDGTWLIDPAHRTLFVWNLTHQTNGSYKWLEFL